MAIGRLRKATRYIARYREIFAVLARYGLADWAHRIELDFLREILSRQAQKELLDLTTEDRIRRALMELGPTFIKFGQLLSVRPDIVGVALSEELKKLQSDVKADPSQVSINTIESELGAKIDDIFDRFDPVPVASASIAQVHQAWLKTGEKVAVKVRHPNIEKVVAIDMDILKDLAELVETYVEDAKFYRPKETVDRFAKTLTREMDFMREARSIINLREDLAEMKDVKIPKVYEDYTTSKALVMDWIDGIAINQLNRRDMIERFGAAADIPKKVANLYLQMIFVKGFYHADPHPGNIMIMGDGSIGLIDFGMTGRLSTQMKEYIEDLIPAIITSDSEKITRIIIKAGSLPPTLDEGALSADLMDFIAYYGSMPIAKIKLFEALNEVVAIVHRHHIILPSEAIMLIKTLVTLEGTNRALQPDFNLLSLLGPYQDSLGASIMTPLRRLSKITRYSDMIQDFMTTVPPGISDIIERLRRETLEIHMEHKGLEHSVNRLVFGLLTAALFIGSSMVLSAGVPPTIYGLSLFGIVGYIVSLFMGIRILWTIMSSGRLD